MRPARHPYAAAFALAELNVRVARSMVVGSIRGLRLLSEANLTRAGEALAAYFDPLFSSVPHGDARERPEEGARVMPLRPRR